MGPTVLFTHLKIILLQYFSVFSYIQTDPKVETPKVSDREIERKNTVAIKITFVTCSIDLY